MSSSENDPKKAEEMSLAELLGTSEAANISNEETPAEDSDDDKSGLINLSQMAALLAAPTQPQAQPEAPVRQSMEPMSGYQGGMPGAGSIPPAPQQSLPTSYPPPSAGMRAMNDYADVAPQKKKSPVALFAIVAIAVIAGGVGAFVALSGNSDDKAVKVAQLEAELAKAESNVATADNTAPTAAPEATAEAEQPAAAVAESADANTEDATAENGSADDNEDYVIEEEEVDDGKGGKKRRKVRRVRRKASKASSSASAPKATAAAVAEAPKPAAKAAAPAPAPKSKTPEKSADKTSDLDSLLSGGGGGGSAGNDGGLPQKPSRGQVQSAMGSVARKAKGVCGKSGSGKVSVRIIVGSNGVVRDAIPLGAHSADTLGRCVATFARRTARLPAFKAPTFTFTYPFNI
ncbi:MAG: hypothetical protein JXR76_25735 [Deltaproteobacteria bacterium]|nr:hypothetical protein [Deltaproteobacteria bacterium]